MLKAAILGLSHSHASGFYNAFAPMKDEVELIGAADVPPYDDQDTEARGRSNLKKAYDVLPIFADYRELLAKKPDLVLVASDNRNHCKIACETLSMGIPTMVEKPMAIGVDDAIRMAACAEKNGVMLACNWPIAWFPAFNLARKMVDEGKVGKLMRVTYRSPATWGPYSYAPDGQNPPVEQLAKTWWYKPEMGGGSILDYACYGAALSTWFFGKQAERVSGIRKNFCLPGLEVEDFSAMMLDFGDGVGLLEGSWSTFNCGEVPSGPIVHGTEGTIVCDRHSTVLKYYTGRAHGHVPPTEVVECGKVDPANTLGRNVVDHLTKGTPLHPLLDARRNVSVMAALDAGRKSADTGVTVETTVMK